MSSPARQHARKKSRHTHAMRWLAAEPFRLFFASGALWSVIGVSLWPLFYARHLDFYPNLVHARIMIEAFGGAFVIGFLGTAGPRMASAPGLSPLELLWLFLLHQACGISHLTLHSRLGDGCFLVLLFSLLLTLLIRVIRFRREPPPPQMLLAVAGPVSGIAGAALHLIPSAGNDPQLFLLANLLIYQGLLLPPALGIGSIVFPRMLGGGFGESGTAGRNRRKLVLAASAAVLLEVSFFVEAWGHAIAGYGLRAVVAVSWLLVEIRWKREKGGSLTTGLLWALGLGLLGLVLAPFHAGAALVSAEHLLFIGGFGLLMFVVGSRVLFGHSGDLPGFHQNTKWARFLIFAGVLAALTRATPAWVPSTTVSHHIYAAWLWISLSLLWLLWHRRRFTTRDEEED